MLAVTFRCLHITGTSTAVMSAAAEPKTLEHQVSPIIESERIYLTGIRLVIVLGSVTLVSFLVLLDMSILGTVG